MPIITSVLWIRSYTSGESTKHIEAISVSCLLLDIKFLLFFRAFESFGIYFAIILGVAKRIIFFLFIIFTIILSFTHAFLILLRPKSNFSKDDRGDLNDPNNPWVLTRQYHQISEDGNIMNPPFLIEEPDENTDLFSRSEEHTSELQSPCNLVCRLLLEKKKTYMCALRTCCDSPCIV